MVERIGLLVFAELAHTLGLAVSSTGPGSWVQHELSESVCRSVGSCSSSWRRPPAAGNPGCRVTHICHCSQTRMASTKRRLRSWTPVCPLRRARGAAHPHKASVCDNEPTQQPPRTATLHTSMDMWSSTFASKHVYEQARLRASTFASSAHAHAAPSSLLANVLAYNRACSQTFAIKHVREQRRAPRRRSRTAVDS